MSVSSTLSVGEATARLPELTVVDVRTPGAFASGHLPDSVNVPLDRIERSMSELRQTAEGGALVLVCASGVRSGKAAAVPAEALCVPPVNSPAQPAGYPFPEFRI
ncbi:rhodanese-like domain-containing protein [Streptomyces sp. NPDC001674]|uniref:rhodanese-like domain-containing protein n=1 Tax=unclassified Streptomyces TaxID=2593676 RepID=UPI003319D3DB